jgi:flagellar biosynthesis protein FlhF
MEYFTIQGATPREALATMKRLYGPEARIQSHRPVRVGGVMGLFSRHGVEITGFVEPSAPEHAAPEATDLDDEKRKILHRASSGTSLQRLADEVAALRSRLDASLPDGARIALRQTGHPQLDALDTLLLRNDFGAQVRLRLIDQVRAEFPLSRLDDLPAVHQYVARQIGLELRLAAPLAEAVGAAAGPRICTVVGPTGVGKTTTIAKLAALHAIGGSAESADCRVRIVTIDNYRIGARQQIETYGEIMRIPVTAAETAEELKKAVALGHGADLIFIDTAGRSPGDYARLAEMRSVLDAVGRHGTTQLAVSATTKYADLEEILRQFEPFAYDSVIVTKLDETATSGNLLSALASARKPVSYCCDGQVVPQDIAPASIVRLLLSLDGFRLDRRLLEREFGAGTAAGANAAGVPPKRTHEAPRVTS